MATHDDLTPGFKPPVNYGPVSVEVRGQANLIILANSANLLEAMSPAECKELEAQLQQVFNRWCERKNIPHQ